MGCPNCYLYKLLNFIKTGRIEMDVRAVAYYTNLLSRTIYNLVCTEKIPY